MASILKVDTIQDQSGNNIINENADTITIGASGDTINLASGVTGTLTSRPVFFVDHSNAAGQIVTSGVATKMVLDRVIFDADSAFDVTTNYRFTVPSGQDGKYLFKISLAINDRGTAYNRVALQTSKNGTLLPYIFDNSFSGLTVTSVFNGLEILDLNAGDYVEFFGIAYGGSTQLFAGASGAWGTPTVARTTSVAGFKLIGS